MEQAEKRPFVPLPPLAQSDFHAEVLGSSERRAQRPEDYHRPEHEYLSDEELRARLNSEIYHLRVHLRNREDTTRWKSWYQKMKTQYVFPNLRYMQAIGRLPGYINIKELEEEFPDIT
jgi:hypothetical protein